MNKIKIPDSRKLRVAAIAGGSLVVFGAGTGAGLVLTSGGAAPPPSAQAVAGSVGATGFAAGGPAPVAGVQDSGTATWHGMKIGIDTFATDQVRDSWVSMSANFGVSPLQEGAHWVIYRSVAG